MPRKTARPRSPTSPLHAAFEPVRRAATGLPEVEESTSYGTPALKVRGKFLTRLKEDGETIVLRVDFDSRDAMMRVQPDIFYITDHYRDYPAVLVRLKTVSQAPAPRVARRCLALRGSPEPARREESSIITEHSEEKTGVGGLTSVRYRVIAIVVGCDQMQTQVLDLEGNRAEQTVAIIQ